MINDQASITRQLPRTKAQKTSIFDLEERTLKFAKSCRDFVKDLSSNTANFEYGKQLIRSSGSVGANYIEANEALSKKDFLNRIKICRKEAKETAYWLELVLLDDSQDGTRQPLVQEARELTLIFNSIVQRSTK